MNANPEQFRDALGFIPADGRDTWLRMGMAIKSELGDAGFNVWDAWSQLADSYDASDARDVWKSIRTNGKVTAGTLFYEAKAHGWRDDGTYQKPTPEELAERRRIATERAAKADADRAAEQVAAREHARRRLAETVPAQAHDYLTRKGIQAHGARFHNENLVLPIRDSVGTLQSLQYIDADGGKKYLPGGKVQGGYFSIGKPDGVLCICEGFATGASINEATGYAVAVAFDCGNLLSVTKAIRAKFPEMQLIVCADDDYKTDGNPGLTKATEAARTVGGLLAIPRFGNDRPDNSTDFNDLHQAQGLESVRKCIEAVIQASTADLNVAGDTQALPETPITEDSAPAAPQSDDDVIAWLASMKVLEYERVRVEQAKLMKCRPTVLDALVKSARHEEEAERLPFPEVEPHPEPIDPAQLLNEITDTIRCFIVLDKEQAHAAALWIAFTWFVEVVEVAPLAIINAPEKACGKSHLLTIIGRMAARPLPAASSSPSFLFRAIEAWKPTVLIDEADTFIRENDELKGLVNAGHTRANAYVGRTVAVGDNHEPRLFNVWGAKAFAG